MQTYLEAENEISKKHDAARSIIKAGTDPDIQDSLGASAGKYASLFKNETILVLFNTVAPKSA